MPPIGSTGNDDERDFLLAIAEGLERAAAYQVLVAKPRRVIRVKGVRRRPRKGVA